MRIGHASIDERGNISGGISGDQTGKEVCIRQYYDKNWQYVLRPKDPKVAEKSAEACEFLCKWDMNGYDQSDRNSLLKDLEAVNWDYKRLIKPTECDCSSFMTACAICGGAKIDYKKNAPHTGSMRTRFKNSGAYEVINFVSPGYNKLRRGDILLKEGAHTVMVLDNYIPGETNRPTIRQGMRGQHVLYLQQRLVAKGYDIGTTGIDGDFGPATSLAVKAFQVDNQLVPDCIVGPKTWAKLG